MTDDLFDPRPANQPPEGRQPPRRRGPRRVSAAYLERAALHYLERFAASTAALRRVLMRKVDMSAAAHGTDRAQGAEWVEALITRYQQSGLLNDRVYAEGRVASLHRRGGSTRTIRQKMAAKGVDADLVDAALGELARDLGDAEEGSTDLRAAHAYARRRRLGPFRLEAEREAKRDKDLAALARAGFDFDTAARIVDATDPDEILG
ncbi:regulatory protein [Nitrospirillum amazonense]|uniref:Regulatory protein RecX n=1 Tax=Nitrospirillum amazonense TaxID=28077 RepID=A0A560FLT4_9PROT|nr:regulatory protein RecX [Nitrospirillum amazonense]TWB22562.1 regulatory protein [Nitrospirillum amazonense]